MGLNPIRALTGQVPLFLCRTEKSVYRFMQERDAADAKANLVSRYKEQDIPVGWMSDTGVIVKIKLACINLAKQYMMRVVSEIDGLGSKNDEQKKETGLFKRLKEQNREVLLHQGVRFAFRVHQFAGGFTTDSLDTFGELRRRHTDGTN